MPESTVKWHGWIYIQKTAGMNDAFYVSHQGAENKFMGMGASGAENSCKYFEETLALGPVRLFPMGVLGYRVYTGDINAATKEE